MYRRLAGILIRLHVVFLGNSLASLPSGWRRAAPLSLLIPSMFFVVIFLLAIASVVSGSFGSLRTGVAWPSFQNYVYVLTNDYYQRSLTITLRIVLESTALTTLLSYPVGYLLTKPRGITKRIFLTIIVAFVFISDIPRAFSLVSLLGDNGIVNSFLLSTRLIRTPLALVGNELGVVIGITIYSLPFGTLVLAAGMRNINENLELAARSLGANEYKTFTSVLLPLSLPAISAVIPILFALASAAFITPLILGFGLVPFASVDVYNSILQTFNAPLGDAVAVVYTALSLGVLLVIWRVLDLIRKRYARIVGQI